ncbi:ABC transporter-like protein 17 [Elsinoe fawcettii]|nr:ABC transporter-like protein 17 [Elsinoe fawcettii]
MVRLPLYRSKRLQCDRSPHDIVLTHTTSGSRGQERPSEGSRPTTADTGGTSIQYRAILAFTDRSHTTILVIGITSAIIKGVAGPATALLTGKIFGALSGYRPDVGLDDGLVASVRQNVLHLLAVGGASLIIHFIFFTSWVIFGEQQAKEARSKLYTALLKQEMAWFDRRKEGPSAMIPRLNAQIRDLQLAASQPLGAVVAIIANACFSFGLAMWYSWKLTLVIMASIPVVLIFTVLVNQPVSFQGHMQQQKKTEALKVMSDALNTIDIVKCANAQEFEKQRYAAKIKEIAYWFYKTVNINAMQQGFVQFMASALFVQAFYYGGVLVRSGEKNPGDIVTTFLSALSVFTSLNTINAQMLVLELGRIAGGRMQRIISEVEQTATDVSDAGEDDTPKTLFNNLKGSIEFRNVTFAYPTRHEHNVLSRFNVMLPLGSVSFVVGRSGSGKSTLGQLLTRLYEPKSGCISIAGLDIAHFHKKHMRQLVQLVEQQSTLFNDTIRENILLGLDSKNGASRESHAGLVENAIDFAILRSFVNSQEDGVETIVGQHGASVSGGQRQRLALARARIRDAPILVLDESTSALDQSNRDMVIEAIRSWRQGKTTMIITHNMDMIKSDDYVYVMEDGKLVQEGYQENMRTSVTSDNSSFLSDPAGVNTSNPDPDAAIDELFDSYLEDSAPERRAKRLQTLSLLNMPRMRFSMALHDYPWIQLDGSPSDTDERLSSTELSALSARRRSAPPSGQPDDELAHPFWYSNSTFTNRVSVSSISAWSKRTSTALSEAALRAGKMAKQQRISYNQAERQQSREKQLRRTTSIKLNDRAQEASEPAVVQHRPKTLTFKEILKTVWPRLKWKQRVALSTAFPLCAVHAASSPVTSLLTTKLIGTYSFESDSTRKAMIYAVSIIGVAVVDGTTQYLQQMIFEYTAQNWINHVREVAAERILDQPKEWFTHDTNSVGRLVETLDRHADDSRNMLGRFVPLYTIIGYLCTISIIWALITEYRLTLVTLSFFPLIFGLTKGFGRVSRKWEGRSNDAAERVNLVFIDTFACIKTVKLLTAESRFEVKAAAAYNSAYEIGRKRAFWTGAFYGLDEASFTIAQAVIFYYAAVLATKGVPVSDITLVLLMLILAFTQITMILGIIPQASQSRDAATRLLALAHLPSDTHESQGNTRLQTIGEIEFRNVTFSYPSRPSPPALSDVSLTIPQGQYTAIVGVSGSGKSTITSLLTRLYDLPRSSAEEDGTNDWYVSISESTSLPSSIFSPTSSRYTLPPIDTLLSGGIFLSGRRISSHHTATLRERIALVQQSTALLSGSVSANIGYGLTNVDEATIRWAAGAAGADFIESLPEGFGTVIGEGGLGLSGGQQQRIAIARALARKPDVLLLDEPTSALDSETMNGVRETLWKLRREGTTIVVVTHEKRMVEMADMVIVLDAGRVAETGTWGWLMAQREGVLRRLWLGKS